MKVSILEKIIALLFVIFFAFFAVVLGMELNRRETPPPHVRVVQVKIPTGFTVSGFQKNNYVIGTYLGNPAVYDLMQNEIRVAKLTTPTLEANPKGE